MFDLFIDLMDLIADPIIDLALCRFDFKIWGKHKFNEFILGAAFVISVWILFAGGHAGSWFWIIVGLAGAGYFGYIGVRYGIWWVQEGRFGGDFSFCDEIPLPEGDLTTNLSEEEKIRNANSEMRDYFGNRL